MIQEEASIHFDELLFSSDPVLVDREEEQDRVSGNMEDFVEPPLLIVTAITPLTTEDFL